MRKNDPKYEITPAVRGALMAAVFETKPGKDLMGLLPRADEIEEELRAKKIGKLQMGHFDEIEGLPVKALDGLINDMAALMPDYYKALERGNARKLGEVFDKGFPLNFSNPHTGETALHSLAAGGARRALRVLLTYENCNFLIRDKQGRLASELAYLYGDDPALARLLGNKERKQAEAQGVTLTRRP